MQTKPCPSCGALLYAEDDFCPKCGAVLDAELLAADPLLVPVALPVDLPPPPLEIPSGDFDDVLEELTGSFNVLEAASVIFAPLPVESRLEADALTRLSSVLTVREGADPMRAGLSPYQKLVFSLINGNRSVARVGKKSGLPADEVKRAIGVLAERGLIELKGELKPDLRGLLLDDLDDSGEYAVPTADAPPGPRTVSGPAALDALADLASGIGAGTAAPPPVADDGPPVLVSDRPEPPSKERSTPRFAGDRSVVVRAGREELGALWMSNLSKGGLFVETDTPPPAYTQVNISLETPEGSMTLSGEVVHVQLPGGGGPAGAGIQLTSLSKELRERLERYLQGLAPLGTQSAAQSAADASRLDAALQAARALSNGNEQNDPWLALGLVAGASSEVVKARVSELRALLEGPHPTATPPQAARCTNALKLLATTSDRVAALASSTFVAPVAQGFQLVDRPPPSAAPAPVAAAASSLADWGVGAPQAAPTAGVPGVPGMPGVPAARAPAPVAASSAPPPPAARPVAPSPPPNDPRRMRAMQLLESALKELRAGKRASALTYIRMAAEIAPDDPQVKSLLAAWTGKS